MINGWNGDIMIAMNGSVLTDRISIDGGKTWPVKRLVSTKGGYSHLAAGRPGTPSEGLIFLTTDGVFARFNLDWVTYRKDWHTYLSKKQ